MAHGSRRQTPLTIAERLAALQEAIAAGEGRIEQPLLDEARATASHVAERAGLSSEYTVVALAGATGSGKSSLFNALAGEQLAQVGIQRPTTSHAMAVVWPAPGDPDGAGTGPLLDWLEVRSHHRGPDSAAPAPGLVLLDLPDHDSVQIEHRMRADRLVDRADLLVWVVDPQKYADAALHEHYLRPMSGHADVMVLVLNQIDRLSAEEAASCLQDLMRLARADGLESVPVVGVSALTDQGMGQLRDLLADAGRRRQAATARLSADMRLAAGQLADACGTGADQRSHDKAEAALLDGLETAAGVPTVVAAVGSAAMRDARAATGWPVTKWLGKLRPDPLRRLGLRTRPGALPGRSASKDAPRDGTGDGERESLGLARVSAPAAGPAAQAGASLAVRDYVWELTQGLADSWAASAREVGHAITADLPDHLHQAVANTVLETARVPTWWRVVRAAQWVVFAVMVVGLGWLGLLALSSYLRLPEMRTPEVWGLALPTVLAIGGALAGVLIALLSRAAAHVGARRRERLARETLRNSLASLAHDRVVVPVTGELTALQECRRAAQLAAS